MPNYCAQCGAPTPSGNFCSNCGSPLAATPGASAGSTPGASAGSTPGVPRADQGSLPHSGQAPGYAGGRPGSSLSNPFAGVPVADYVRDVLAVLLLLTSLGLPWDHEHTTGGRWWAAVSVVVALVSVALPYVGQTGVLPGWGPRQVRVLKVAAFVPLAVSVVAALVNELVHVGEPFDGGIGTGLTMALAGGLLAVQPRAADEERSPREDRTWSLAARVAAVVALALLVLTWLAYVIEDAVDEGVLFDDSLRLLLAFVDLAAALVLVGVPVVRLLTWSETGRRVLVAVGATVLVLTLLAETGADPDVFSFWPVEKWDTPLAGSFALVAAAALALSRPVVRSTRPREPLPSWVTTASFALVLAAVGLALVAVRQLLAMVWLENYGAEVMIPIVLTLLGLGALLFARAAVRQLPSSRGLLLSVVAGVLLLGIITAAVGSDFGYPLDRSAFSSWFTLPVLAIWALTVPATVRAAFGPLIADRPPEPMPAADQAPHDGSAEHGSHVAHGSEQGAAAERSGRAQPGDWSTDQTRAFETPPGDMRPDEVVPPPPPAGWPPPPGQPPRSSYPGGEAPPPGDFRP